MSESDFRFPVDCAVSKIQPPPKIQLESGSSLAREKKETTSQCSNFSRPVGFTRRLKFASPRNEMQFAVYPNTTGYAHYE